MQLRHGWHCSDPIPTQLCYRLAFTGVDIDKAIHVADTETLNAILGLYLPLSAQTTRR